MTRRKSPEERLLEAIFGPRLDLTVKVCEFCCCKVAMPCLTEAHKAKCPVYESNTRGQILAGGTKH